MSGGLVDIKSDYVERFTEYRPFIKGVRTYTAPEKYEGEDFYRICVHIKGHCVLEYKTESRAAEVHEILKQYICRQMEQASVDGLKTVSLEEALQASEQEEEEDKENRYPTGSALYSSLLAAADNQRELRSVDHENGLGIIMAETIRQMRLDGDDDDNSELAAIASMADAEAHLQFLNEIQEQDQSGRSINHHRQCEDQDGETSDENEDNTT
jgi:hypothetical protein